MTFERRRRQARSCPSRRSLPAVEMTAERSQTGDRAIAGARRASAALPLRLRLRPSPSPLAPASQASQNAARWSACQPSRGCLVTPVDGLREPQSAPAPVPRRRLKPSLHYMLCVGGQHPHKLWTSLTVANHPQLAPTGPRLLSTSGCHRNIQRKQRLNCVVPAVQAPQHHRFYSFIRF
jgi:hypothetical protein